MIHVAITRRVRPGHEDAFERELRRFMQEAERRPETLGAYLLRPFGGDGDRAYGILRSFHDRTAEEAFYASDLYRDWNEAVRQHVEGEPNRRELHGLEAFFRQDAPTPPPRWKMAILTWLAVNPAVFVCSRVVPSVLDGLHPAIVFPIVNAGVVTLLTWVLMPLGVRVARTWLHAKSAPSTERRPA
jgi:antibiotic biosynthesis monooxygenase (ABM) superfamily enzyme